MFNISVSQYNEYSNGMEQAVQLDLSDKQINTELGVITSKVDELQKEIVKHLSNHSQKYSLGNIVNQGIKLIECPESYMTTIYAPFDVIIHRVNTCILKSWCRSEKPFEVWLKEHSDVRELEEWKYMDYKECLPGMYLVDNFYLCVDVIGLSPTQQNDLLSLLKENRDIALVYQLSHFKPFDRLKFIEKLENSI